MKHIFFFPPVLPKIMCVWWSTEILCIDVNSWREPLWVVCAPSWNDRSPVWSIWNKVKEIYYGTMDLWGRMEPDHYCQWYKLPTLKFQWMKISLCCSSSLVRQHLSRLPTIDPNTRTLLLCGYPNVGKSSFINKVDNVMFECDTCVWNDSSL